jgi:cytochrome c553
VSRIPTLSLRVAGATLLLAFAPLALAAGNVAAGKEKADRTCLACHGPDGNGTGDGQFPLLAGQYADYLAKALHDYRSGARNNAVMAGFTATLSDQDIEDLAAYFASQKGGLKDLRHLK